jgi:GT2 family glycosyltransferase
VDPLESDNAPAIPAVAIVIVAYRSQELLAGCLDSIRRFGAVDGMPAETWVVDNASGDGTVEMVRSRFPDVNLIAAESNIGFSAANNRALRAMSLVRHVLVLNPDAELHADTLPSLVRLLDERREIGMVGCQLLKQDGTMDHAARRSFPTIVGALGHFTGFGRRAGAPEALSQYRATHREQAGEVDAINGAFMLIRRDALADVGDFDEGYWLYMEDLDLCYRFWQRGWLVWYEPTVTATHVKAGTSGTHRLPRQNRAFHYGMYRFYRKFYANERSPLINTAVYLGIGAKLIVSIVRSAVARRLRPGV